MNNKGFTLIEIIIVIVILGIMASLALPNITSAIDKGRIPAALETMGKVQRELDMCFQMADANADAATCTTTADLGYEDGIPSIPGWDFELAGAADALQIVATCDTCSQANTTITFTGEGVFEEGYTIATQQAAGSLQGFRFKGIPGAAADPDPDPAP